MGDVVMGDVIMGDVIMGDAILGIDPAEVLRISEECSQLLDAGLVESASNKIRK